ncbi:hypothetical protein EYF80_042649 [Liparis tanakae]|uniref:Uncharacterized protein n=1 Tax=Liparis tanakae TaxID=230148 RepID=A0A4Z2G226_9TELE|nr:hypothetical protein EYF80_042649 [Liparis tanakae]
MEHNPDLHHPSDGGREEEWAESRQWAESQQGHGVVGSRHIPGSRPPLSTRGGPELQSAAVLTGAGADGGATAPDSACHDSSPVTNRSSI